MQPEKWNQGLEVPGRLALFKSSQKESGDFEEKGCRVSGFLTLFF
jgi:hypothetical protein